MSVRADVHAAVGFSRRIAAALSQRGFL